ncbi:MAG: efflux RND transporter permease subunit [Candidatus Pristimantibacillus lignocellulolyticus]|uniref:Efflux RND transporter permease subunit n=1 Tax=Candidatus Pristimantibacillus lignocellulolyticus TaxID=2994561 RepID=A0A9J6ZHH1_9BACL|nr:MAG: efflux RND transporter permease subunit [Candidatus Pristimantibacillus lignocellulolyticus]
MNSIVNFVLKNKLAVWLLTIIITFSGVYSSTKMNMETIPDISIPYLMVMDVYPGATAEQVMDEVTVPLEKILENLSGVKTVMSTSYSSMSSLQVEYDYGTDMAEAKREIQAALDGVKLPDNAQEPMITAISFNMMPILALSISSESEDIVSLTHTVEDILLPKIEKIEGVASATMTGQHIEEVELTYNTDKMASLGVTEETITNLIKASDMYTSLGIFEFEEAEQAISVDGKFMTMDELSEMLIPVTPTAEQPAPFVKLNELADIELVGKVQSVSRTNGQDAIAIQIVKAQDANTVTVVNELKDLMKDEQERIDGLVVETTLDQGAPIEKSVLTMVEKALFGGLIAILIILLFLRDFKSTIISIVSIPVSLFMALLVLNWLDITLNIMTLGAITVAIGRVIDDSIVVVENIYRRIHLKEEKLSGRALVREATIEMFKPILSSTLVTVAVFAPLVFVGGMIGELFLPFALTMSFALIASLIVAITIVPALSHILFKKKLYAPKTESKHKDVGALAKKYRGALEWTLKHKAITSIISIVILVGSCLLTPLIGVSFLGSEEEKVMYLTYSPKAGELHEDTLKYVTEVEQKLIAREDVDIVQLSISDSADMMSMMSGGAGGSLMYVIFDPDMKNFPEVREEIEGYVKDIGHPGRWGSQNFSMSSMSSNEVSYTLHSEDLGNLEEAVLKVEETLQGSSLLTDVSSTKEESYQAYTIKTDQATLLQYGLTTGQIVMMLYPDTSKSVLTKVESDGKSIEVIVQKEAVTPKSFEDMLKLPVQTPMGTTVELGDIVEIEEGYAVNSLSRSQGQYTATVSGTIVGEDVSKASSDVGGKVEALELPKGVELGEAGAMADIQEGFTQLIVAMLAAIAIVYFILVVTFGEGLAPFVILLSLPFTVIGAFAGLFIAGETISIPVMMGLLMLIGIVVTNAIVLVDRIIHMEREGLSLRESILEAGTTRLRPILMTAIATIGAMIPLAIGGGGGGFISKGLAITVIGGLASSTLLTLIIVPVVYEMLSKLLKKNRREVEEN